MKRISIPIFDVDIEVYTDLKEFEDESEFTITDEEGMTAGNLVYFSDPKDHYTIIHECVHIVDWILEFRLEFKHGESLLNTTEIRAYMTDWLVKEVEECLAE